VDAACCECVVSEAARDTLPATPAAPPGYGDVKKALDDAAQAVAFGKASIADGVSQFFSAAKTALANT
jgi:multiple sugar transport system substrate-binding protein